MRTLTEEAFRSAKGGGTLARYYSLLQLFFAALVSPQSALTPVSFKGKSTRCAFLEKEAGVNFNNPG
ncbi:MAG: hypothetical protein KME30_16080 [Iphinoe sp. HA4291-MV1]|jgi:hypothetical protein|nr:hypothetical protein [Iphinoe sp. HA4291-MV1]